MNYSLVKRLIDITVSFIALLFLVPFFIIIAIIIPLTSKGPSFYFQERLGLKGRIYKMFKFRSMYLNAADIRNDDGTTYNGKDDPRVTKVGKFLRETSINELPQLLNILLGDMSLVGPRPELPESLAFLSNNYPDKLKVLPGLTGWAVVNGRNNVPLEKRRELDVWYARHISFSLDVKIILKTVQLVISSKDVYNEYSKKSSK